MAAKAVQEFVIGPFAGGINTYSDQAAIADNELTDCLNFDMFLDGTLVSRPPWSLLKGSSFTSTSSSSTPPLCSQLVIGTGTFESKRFVIVSSNHSGAFAAYIYYVDGPNAGLIAKIADGEYSKAHRYSNFLYLVPDLSTTGGYRYDLTGGAVTAIASMPSGYASCIYKDRLWIGGRQGVTNDSRVSFSDVGNFTSWPGTNFIDVNPGDGEAVNELTIYQDNIIIFKNSATYVLSYDTSPAQAILNIINNDIGASGRNCVGVYENSIFVLKYNQVYEMSNYDFVRVSVKIPFEYDPSVILPSYGAANSAFKYPLWLSIVGDRVVVRFYNKLYIYHLRLRAWTRWSSIDPNIQYIGPITKLDNADTGTLQGYDTYIAGSALTIVPDSAGTGVTTNWKMYFKLYQMEERYSTFTTENGNITPPADALDIILSLTTKQFNVGLSHRFKRLFHWGVDCYTGRQVTGTLYPQSVTYKVSWNQLSSFRWHELGTFQYPLTSLPSVVQITAPDETKQIKFVRFPKSLRFRLLKFRLDLLTKGNTSDGPVRVYSITTFIQAKELVPKGVN
ncbi:hypothetical protein ACFY7C_36630 [Streptomyces sp. NPDC012769]|uniref:hypothetical protein n=1 Tax=Streptomyces sp. NPDC012769 TaxID=3364848 RepID=UPI0036ABE11A